VAGIGEEAVIEIFDVNGAFVSRIFEGRADPGLNTVTWDGTHAGGGAAASGVYFCRLRCGNRSVSRKMVLLR
jgi:hypothetical protein